jgi:hypothetical protein
MHRDLVDQRHWLTEDTYKLSLALAQIMPGPLAAQVAIAIGYFEGGILGATLGGLGLRYSLVFDGGCHLDRPTLRMVACGGCRRYSMRSAQR